MIIQAPCICKGKSRSCIYCEGTGEVPKVGCRRCNGTGKEGGAKCVDCRGNTWRSIDQTPREARGTDERL